MGVYIFLSLNGRPRRYLNTAIDITIFVNLSYIIVLLMAENIFTYSAEVLCHFRFIHIHNK